MKINQQPFEKTPGDFIEASDRIYAESINKVNFQIKQRRVKLKLGQPLVKSLAVQRLEEIEETINQSKATKNELSEYMNVAEIRNKVMLNN